MNGEGSLLSKPLLANSKLLLKTAQCLVAASIRIMLITTALS